MATIEYLSGSTNETEEIASKLADSLMDGDVIAYKGKMGAGKTAFTRGLVKGLGGGDVVSSPTFALVNEYSGKFPIYHFDMYRVNTIDDLYSTGFFDYLDTDAVLVIEWSENIETAIPKDAIIVSIDYVDGDVNKRKIKIEDNRK